MRVDVNEVSVHVDGVSILHTTSLQAPAGRIVGLIGPNGSGKSTLINVVTRTRRPQTGTVHVDGDDIWRLTARQNARRVAVLRQTDDVEFDFTVREVVALGRLPHQRLAGRASRQDHAVVDDALERCKVHNLRHRQLSTLSGGERQRALIARAIAQQPRVLVLDEPSNHLDVGSQLEILDLVRSLNITVIVALHDLNLAAAYCHDIVALQHGAVVAAGLVDDLLTTDLATRLYGVRAYRQQHPLTGRPSFTFATPTPNQQETLNAVPHVNPSPPASRDRRRVRPRRAHRLRQ